VLLVILVANLLVVALKAAVGLATGSLAVMGDALHASVDAINNLFGLAVVRVAARGPDADHPYGHAKAETLGALVIVVFLSITLSQLLDHSLERLLSGHPPPDATPLALGILVLTAAVNLGVVAYETREGRRLHSEFLIADAHHTRADVLITLAVIAGLLLSRLGLAWADPVLALLVAGMVVRIAVQILRQALPTLMDEAAVEGEALARAARGVPGVCDAYGSRSRRAGAHSFAELTISVEGAASVTRGHEIADAVEATLRREFGLREVVVHVEPCDGC
jgi:cation diffusion facilitator family transporter